MLNIQDVDVRTELEQFEWHNATWSGVKLIAASPFRYDKSPSFYVWLDGKDKGAFGDSGAFEDEYRKGGFIKLLAFMRQEPYEDTLAYLEEQYGVRELKEGDVIVLPSIVLNTAPSMQWIQEDFLDELECDYSYLEGRGIGKEVQQLFDVRYDSKHNSVAMPWRHISGKIANIKYRNVSEKQFYYAKDATAIRELLYGMHLIYEQNIRKVVIVESEIDAMTLWQAGVPAVALGTASLNDRQISLLMKSPVEEYIIGTDNDKAGDKVATKIKDVFGGLYSVKRFNWAPYKDANERYVAQLKEEAK